MLSVALNIKSVTEEMRKIPVHNLYDAIRNPKPEVSALLRQLRIVREMNANLYSTLKHRLPYFVCGMFNPSYRRSENFAYTEYFIIDIDHLSSKGLVVADLRKTICGDPRTVLCFMSPGGDGLKVLMKLTERCYDAGLYKTFYKLFVAKFSHQYGLEQVVDAKTCDVTRACFLSADPDAYYNADAEKVAVREFVNPEENVSLAFDLKHKADLAERKAEKYNSGTHSSDPDTDVMAEIRQTLDLKSRNGPPKPEAYVPPELNEIMDNLRAYVEERGILVEDVINIQYGKKLRFKVANKKAEINLFYGKKGFSVVQSPRTGTDKSANELMAEVINCFLAENANI